MEKNVICIPLKRNSKGEATKEGWEDILTDITDDRLNEIAILIGDQAFLKCEVAKGDKTGDVSKWKIIIPN